MSRSISAVAALVACGLTAVSAEVYPVGASASVDAGSQNAPAMDAMVNGPFQANEATVGQEDKMFRRLQATADPAMPEDSSSLGCSDVQVFGAGELDQLYADMGEEMNGFPVFRSFSDDNYIGFVTLDGNSGWVIRDPSTSHFHAAYEQVAHPVYVTSPWYRVDYSCDGEVDASDLENLNSATCTYEVEMTSASVVCEGGTIAPSSSPSFAPTSSPISLGTSPPAGATPREVGAAGRSVPSVLVAAVAMVVAGLATRQAGL